MISSLIDSSRTALVRASLKLHPATQSEFELLRSYQWLGRQQVLEIQEERLQRLLQYAHRHVAYYRELFERTGMVAAGRVSTDRFRELPILDKPTIRNHFAALTSDEAPKLHVATNRTGGSSGEPLVVLQGRDEVRVTGGAVLRLFYEWHGAKPGDREIRLWGSKRDLDGNERPSLEGLRHRAQGLTMLNAFRMTPERMELYVRVINEQRPTVLRGYSSNLFELAEFAEQRGLGFTPPGCVISSAGTLYPHLRATMERVYGARTFNHYGSREMHNMAMECPEGTGLHVSALTHLVEVLDDAGRSCAPGVEGDLVITNLKNFAMPLIRYRIGDRGSLAVGDCGCGRGLPRLAKLSGRRVDCFWTREGRMVPGEYFVHVLGVELAELPISKFQVAQEDYDAVRFSIALFPGSSLALESRLEIESKTRLVMGPSCAVSFDLVDDIRTADSGKYVYTICRIPGVSQPTLASEPA